jgi:hypothetical protein
MPRRFILVISLITGISLCSYLLASRLTYATGFPLDDAWIHQTYARNLVQAGEWAFLPGVPSAGSTSPAWTLALAAGYWLSLNPLAWAYFLGWGLLAGISLMGARSMGWLLVDGEKWGIWAGCLLALEWHLVWAAASGMETLAFAFIILLVLALPVRFDREETDPDKGAAGLWQWLGLGVLVGLGVWIRPDGISLLAALGFTIMLGKYQPELKLRIVLLVGVGFLVLFIPYLWFNHSLSGGRIRCLPSKLSMLLFVKRHSCNVIWSRHDCHWLEWGLCYCLDLFGWWCNLFDSAGLQYWLERCG